MSDRKDYEEIEQPIRAEHTVDVLLSSDLLSPFKSLITEGFDPNYTSRLHHSTWSTPTKNNVPLVDADGVDERPILLRQPWTYRVDHDCSDTPQAGNMDQRINDIHIINFSSLLPMHYYQQSSSSWSKKVSEGIRRLTIGILCSAALAHLRLNGVLVLLEGMAIMLVGAGIIPCLVSLGEMHFNAYFNSADINGTAVIEEALKNGEGISDSSAHISAYKRVNRRQPRARTMKKADWLQSKYNIYNFQATEDSDSDSSMDSCVGWYRNATPPTPTTTIARKNRIGNAYIPGQLSPEPVKRRFRLGNEQRTQQQISSQGKDPESSVDEEEETRGRDRKVKRLSLSRKLSFVNSVEHHVLSGDEAGFSVSEDSFSGPHYHDESFNVDVDTNFLSNLRTEAQSPSPRFETGDTTRSHAGTNGNLRFRVKRSSSKEAESWWYSDH